MTILPDQIFLRSKGAVMNQRHEYTNVAKAVLIYTIGMIIYKSNTSNAVFARRGSIRNSYSY